MSNINLILQNIKILWEKTIEYKVNFYVFFFEHMIYVFVTLFFLKTFYNNFSSVSYWVWQDYLLFFILIDIFMNIAGLIIWNRKLWLKILRGKLNEYLYRPKNPYLIIYC